MSEGNGVAAGVVIQPVNGVEIELVPVKRRRGRPTNAERDARAAERIRAGAVSVGKSKSKAKKTGGNVRSPPREVDIRSTEWPVSVESDPIADPSPVDSALGKESISPEGPARPSRFHLLPDIAPPTPGTWEEVPFALLYSSEPNGARDVAGLVVGRVNWGGGIDAFMLRLRDACRIQLADGSVFEAPRASFIAVPVVAELSAVAMRMDERPEFALAVEFKPVAIQGIDDSRETYRYKLRMMWTDIPRAEALVVKP